MSYDQHYSIAVLSYCGMWMNDYDPFVRGKQQASVRFL